MMASSLTESMLGSEKYLHNLTRELKCPCGSYLQPPIRLCARGHGVCLNCRRRHRKCPTCEDVFTETRSMALEAIADKLHFPCPHEHCPVMSPLRQLKAHSEDCSMRPTSCFMNKVYEEGCVWRGRADCWLEHCLLEHPARVTDLPFVSFSEPWTPQQRSPVMRYHLLRCFERVFNLYQIYDTKSGKMMWSVVMTGEGSSGLDDSRSYYFDLELFKPSDITRKISFRQSCKNGDEMDILESSVNVLVTLQQVLYMLDEGSLHFSLRIHEVSISSASHMLPIKDKIQFI